MRAHVIPTFASPPLSLIEVQDLARLLLAAAEHGTRIPPVPADAPGQGFYFACQDSYPNYAQLGKLISTALGYRHVLYIPLAHPLPWLIGGTAQLVCSAINKPSAVGIDKIREASVESWACSPAAVLRDCGFQFSGTITEQLRQTGEWYREEGWL